MTQNARLLNYLETHPNGITTLEAMQHLKVLRLSERIRELSKYYEFSHTPEHTENARVIRYRLLKAAGLESASVRASVQTSKPTDGRPDSISAPISAAPFSAPQVVHSLPTPPVGAGAASYKAWMRG